MVSAEKFDILRRHISRHIALTVEEAEVLRSLFTVRRIRRRQYLLQEGDVSHYESYVLSGCLRAYVVDNEGFEHVLQFAIEDWWIGDMASFITGEPATLAIDALEDSEVLQLEKGAQEELYARVPTFDRFFRMLLQNAFVAHQRRILGIIAQTAEQRYLDFVTRYPKLVQRIPQKHIASYLGMTPEFLSRMRSELTVNRRKKN
ncbi:MAG: Crp/Fnr family transcriptional regulator [Ignavibacteriae bacterium]|nr:Crp/Fnr family transcriptional regulator [Ignavibacteriota bacterium]